MTTITFGATDSLLLIKQSTDDTRWEFSLNSGSSYTQITTYPVTISKNIANNLALLIRFESDLNISSINHGIIININSNLTIDGQNKFITTNNTQTNVKPFIRQNSLLQLSNLTVKNIQYNGNKKLLEAEGFVFDIFFGQTGNNIVIDSIINYSNIEGNTVNDTQNAGIFSNYAFKSAKNVLVKNCKNYGNIVSVDSGGIFGPGAFDASTGVGIENCFNAGNIIGKNSGGIVGWFSFENFKTKGIINVNNKLHIVYKCYNTGAIVGQDCGGIFGNSCFEDIVVPDAIDLPTDGLIISNCYNTGNIQNTNSGGIFGSYAFLYLDNTNLNVPNYFEISYCYNTGNITGTDAGGLFGYTFFSLNPSHKTININHCYNTGTLSSNTQGGIMAKYLFSLNEANTFNITNCYSVVPALYSANSIYPTQAGDVRIINLTNTSSDNSWTPSNAFTSLGGVGGTAVNNTTNNYRNYTLSGSYTDVSVVNINGTISVPEPYKLTSFYSSGTNFSQILPGTSIVIDSNPIGTYSIVSSNIINFSGENFIYSTFGTIDGAIIITSNNLANQSNKKFIIYQSNALKNNLTNITQTGTYNILLFSISFQNKPVICMGENTLITILENNNEIQKPVKELEIGQLVKTENCGYIPIKHIYKSVLYNSKNEDGQRKKDKIYVLSPEKFPELKQNLYLTGGHPLLVEKLSDSESKRQNKLYLKKSDKKVGDYYVLLTFICENAMDCIESGLFPIYNLVLGKNETSTLLDRYIIRINGLLTSSMSLEKYNKYIIDLD